MRKLGIGLLLAVFVAVAAAGASAASHHKTHHKSAAGIIEAWDATSHMLTLKTSKDTASFKVGDGTQIWIGSQTGTAEDLSKEQGAKATVKYSVNGSEMFASTVRISPSTSAHKSK